MKTACVMNLNFTSEYNYGKQITQKAMVKPGIAPRTPKGLKELLVNMRGPRPFWGRCEFVSISSSIMMCWKFRKVEGCFAWFSTHCFGA